MEKEIRTDHQKNYPDKRAPLDLVELFPKEEHKSFKSRLEKGNMLHPAGRSLH